MEKRRQRKQLKEFEYTATNLAHPTTARQDEKTGPPSVVLRRGLRPCIICKTKHPGDRPGRPCGCGVAMAKEWRQSRVSRGAKSRSSDPVCGPIRKWAAVALAAYSKLHTHSAPEESNHPLIIESAVQGELHRLLRLAFPLLQIRTSQINVCWPPSAFKLHKPCERGVRQATSNS